MRTLVVSDLHLGNGGPYDIFAGTEALPQVLAHASPDRLIINGDGVDFLLDDAPIDRLDEARAVEQARAIVEHNRALLELLGASVKEVVIRLGNHDAELALPAVQAVLAEPLGGPGKMRFVLGDETDPLIEVGGVRVLVTHGEHTDFVNRLQYRRLRDPAAWPKFVYPPGSHLVKVGLNPLKAEGARFADLVKPDFQGGFLAAGAVLPGTLARLLDQEVLGLAWRMLRARFGRRTFLDEAPPLPPPDAVDEALQLAWLRAYAWAHRRLAGGGSGFFDLQPEPGELREVGRLQRRFGCRAVLMGHTHAARWLVADSLAYANTGTWIPLVSLPAPDAPDAEWAVFLACLRADPGMVDKAADLLIHRFHAALVEPEGTGARLSLLRWEEGQVHTDREATLGPPAPAVHVADPARSFRPLLVGLDGEPMGAEGLAPPPVVPGLPSRIETKALGTLMRAGDPDDVAQQGWGLVVPPGAGDRMDALRPLIARREEQTGEAALVLEVDPGRASTIDDALVWARERYLALDREERPAYLMLVGDLHEVPLALQQVLAAEAMVGRVAFTRPDGAPDLAAHGAYAAKVQHYETAAPVAPRPDLLLFAVDDGTLATEEGRALLIDPASRWFRGELGRRRPADFGAVHLISPPGLAASIPEDLLDYPAIDGPNVLLTLSHGLGLPAGHSQQRALQGAMSFGHELLTARDLAGRRFLPGGLWVYIACFGAGTPAESSFAPWLAHTESGVQAADVLRCLSPTAFVAALPQAALAEPEGPLAVVGHVDLAWVTGLEKAAGGVADAQAFRRFADLLRQFEVRPIPGAAQATFGRACRDIDAQVRRFDHALGGQADPANPAQPSELWIARNDFASYVLLGDPAARLPVSGGGHLMRAMAH